MDVTSTQILELFRISREQLRRWREKGCPQVARGHFDLRAVIEWRDKTLLSSDKMTAAKLEREQAKAKIATLEAKEKEGSLIPRTQSIIWLSTLVSEAKSHFWGLPKRLSASLALITDEKEIEEIMRKEIRRILEDLSRPLKDRKKGARAK